MNTKNKIHNEEVNHIAELSLHELLKYLPSIGIRTVEVLNEIASTNTYVKQKSSNDEILPLLVVAEEQTAGKGRFTRTFVSVKRSGIFVSLALPAEVSWQQMQKITIIASLAVANMIEQHYQLSPKIKWPNDVYVNQKKVCGILCESVFDGSECRSIIVGIGINTHTTEDQIPESLKSIMTSLQLESGINANRNKLLVTLFQSFFWYYHLLLKHDTGAMMERYRRLSFLVDSFVTIDESKTQYRVVGIDDDGHILLQDGFGNIITKQSGEVSLKIGEQR